MRKPPPEPPVCKDVGLLAPGFYAKLRRVLAKHKARGWNPVINETVRTNERQAWLFGFGREWDDGRGRVTDAPTNVKSWHGYGLAVDIKSADHDYEHTPLKFWTDLAECVRAEQLTTGADWLDKNGQPKDRPHIQWWTPGMRAAPSPLAAQLQEDGGNRLVWDILHAV